MSRLTLGSILIATTALAQVVGAPAIPPRAAWTPPVPVERKLACGARAWVLPRPGLPLVSVDVVVTAGSMQDPPGKPGLAALTATALEEGGAGERGPAEVLAAFDALGTQLEVATGADATSLAFTVLTPKLDTALGLTADLLTRPRFDAAAFDALKKRRVTEITAMRDDRRTLAAEVLLATMYGDGPRGHLSVGTPAAVGAMTLDDVRQFHRARWTPSQVTFVVAGDITPDGAQRLLDGLLPKPWQPPAAPPAAKETAAAPTWIGVDKPGAPQSVLQLGRVAFRAADPRVPPAELTAMVLGGSFTSRLVQNLREKHGYTYGVRAQVGAGATGGTLFVATSVKTEVTAEALEQLLLELRGISTLGPADRAKAQALLEQSLVDALGSGSSAAAAYGELVEVGLPPDKLAKYGAALTAVTPEQLAAAAKDWTPEGFTVVIVGDRAKIEKPLGTRFPKQAITWRPAPE